MPFRPAAAVEWLRSIVHLILYLMSDDVLTIQEREEPL